MSALTPSSPALRLALLALAALTCVPDTAATAAAGELPAISSRQRNEKKSFSDGEIVEGFLKTAFGAEYHLAGRVVPLCPHVGDDPTAFRSYDTLG